MDIHGARAQDGDPSEEYAEEGFGSAPTSGARHPTAVQPAVALDDWFLAFATQRSRCAAVARHPRGDYMGPHLFARATSMAPNVHRVAILSLQRLRTRH